MPVFLISGFDLSMLCKTPSNTVLFTHIDRLFMMYFIRFKNALSKALRDLPCVRACAELVHHCILDVVVSYIYNEWSGRHMSSASRIGFIQFFLKEMEMTTMQAWYKIHL